MKVNLKQVKLHKSVLMTAIMTGILTVLTSCFPYVYHEREKVLIENPDIDTTIKIAEIELEEGGFDSVLTLWAIRDQYITPAQAGTISDLYFEYIETLDTDFGTWHLAWAISNLYRHGDEDIKAVLQDAMLDAKMRPSTLNAAQRLLKNM
jgi:hypothetical protein